MRTWQHLYPQRPHLRPDRSQVHYFDGIQCRKIAPGREFVSAGEQLIAARSTVNREWVQTKDGRWLPLSLPGWSELIVPKSEAEPDAGLRGAGRGDAGLGGAVLPSPGSRAGEGLGAAGPIRAPEREPERQSESPDTVWVRGFEMLAEGVVVYRLKSVGSGSEALVGWCGVLRWLAAMKKEGQANGIALPQSVKLPWRWRAVAATDTRKLQACVAEIQAMLGALTSWSAQHDAGSPEALFVRRKLFELFCLGVEKVRRASKRMLAAGIRVDESLGRVPAHTAGGIQHGQGTGGAGHVHGV